MKPMLPKFYFKINSFLAFCGLHSTLPTEKDNTEDEA